jgi:hypothetical protein
VTQNWDLVANLNLNKIIYAYGWYGFRQAIHTKYEGSSTDEEWNFSYYMVGLGWYVTPVIKMYLGYGSVIEAKNEEDAPEYGSINEKGIGYDFHVYGYKIELGYRIVEVPLLSEDEIPVEDAPAQGNFETFYVGFSAPFSLW